MTTPDLTRRAFGGAAVIGVAAPLLVACGGDDETPAKGTSSGKTSSSPSEGGGSPSPDGGGAEPLVAASEVAVGGGVILQDEKLVVTQPAAGEFKCFSAVCTHQGCVVGSVEGSKIVCGCHGSVFSAEDGSVLNGPATAALSEVPVVVEGGQVVKA